MLPPPTLPLKLLWTNLSMTWSLTNRCRSAIITNFLAWNSQISLPPLHVTQTPYSQPHNWHKLSRSKLSKATKQFDYQIRCLLMKLKTSRPGNLTSRRVQNGKTYSAYHLCAPYPTPPQVDYLLNLPLLQFRVSLTYHLSFLTCLFIFCNPNKGRQTGLLKRNK
jgi:hypothetical protein